MSLKRSVHRVLVTRTREPNDGRGGASNMASSGSGGGGRLRDGRRCSMGAASDERAEGERPPTGEQK